jgi:hypothetical protein
MASGDFRDLAETQKETARALQTLASELRRSSSPGDLGRLTSTLAPAESRDSLQARVIREIAPSYTAGRSGTDVAGGLAGTAQQVSEVEQTLKATRDAVRELSSTLTGGAKDLERALAGFSGGLQGLLSGVIQGTGGGGFGGLLTSGFGLAGLGLKIAGLFGKKKPEPTVFTPFELPPSLALEAANSSDILGGFPRFDRGQSGEPRSFRSEAPVSQPQVVVNVNALDSQSFMDRSSDIARAVRDAMLHMHPINDMIGEL